MSSLTRVCVNPWHGCSGEEDEEELSGEPPLPSSSSSVEAGSRRSLNSQASFKVQTDDAESRPDEEVSSRMPLASDRRGRTRDPCQACLCPRNPMARQGSAAAKKPQPATVTALTPRLRSA